MKNLIKLSIVFGLSAVLHAETGLKNEVEINFTNADSINISPSSRLKLEDTEKPVLPRPKTLIPLDLPQHCVNSTFGSLRFVTNNPRYYNSFSGDYGASGKMAHKMHDMRCTSKFVDATNSLSIECKQNPDIINIRADYRKFTLEIDPTNHKKYKAIFTDGLSPDKPTEVITFECSRK